MSTSCAAEQLLSVRRRSAADWILGEGSAGTHRQLNENAVDLRVVVEFLQKKGMCRERVLSVTGPTEGEGDGAQAARIEGGPERPASPRPW